LEDDMNDDSHRLVTKAVTRFREAAVAANVTTIEAPGVGAGWSLPLPGDAQYPRLFVPATPGASLMIDAGHSLVLATQGRLAGLGLSNNDTIAILERNSINPVPGPTKRARRGGGSHERG
jgi:hypothetical protein